MRMHANVETDAALAYDQLVARFVARYAAGKKRAACDLWQALDASAWEDLRMPVPVPHEHMRALRESVARDLAQIASVLVRGTCEDATAIGRLAGRQGSLRLLLEALRLSGDAVFRVAGVNGEAHVRRAGEATCAGTLRCLGCGATRCSRQAVVAVACTACGGAEFAKNLRI